MSLSGSVAETSLPLLARPSVRALLLPARGEAERRLLASPAAVMRSVTEGESLSEGDVVSFAKGKVCKPNPFPGLSTP